MLKYSASVDEAKVQFISLYSITNLKNSIENEIKW